jgi:tetratricopeptide (TPR) repeat protein
VRSTSFPENHTPLSAFDRAIEGLLVILLTFMPLAFGAVESWSQQIVVMICWAMMVCLGLKAVFHSDFELVWSWAYVPLGLLLLIVTVQLVPLPSWALAAVSPNTVALKTRLLGNLLPTEETSGGVTISFYSLATARALRLALSVVAVFFVTVNVYRRTDQIKRLLAVVSVIGGGIALLALAQAITNTDRIFWLTSVGGPALGGPFVNRNNFCQFMNLSVWAALALLLVNLKENSTGTPLAVSTVRKHLKTMDARLVWWLLGTIVLGAATVFLSLSRGGMISLVVSVGSALLVLAIKRRLNTWGWVVTTMAMGGLACVLYIGFDAVYDRMASLRDPQAYQGRWQLARDTVRASESFPVFGAGLGTHEFVYPMFDQSTISAKAVHAENEYAQIAEETGIVGLLLAATFGAAVCVSLVRCVRRDEPPIHIAVVGLGAGLLAVAVHSFVDFGQRLPANACLSAVFCGLLVGMAKVQTPNVPASKRKTGPVLRKIVAAIALTGVSAVWSWALMGADAARRSERAWRDVQQLEKGMRQNGWAVTNGDYVELVLAAKKASMIEPVNALYRHWLNVYRWRSISRVTDPETGNTVLGPRGLECARSIVSDLKEAMALCPTFGPSYSLAGQLGWAILGDAEGPDLIRKGYFLGPCDAEASFAAGLLDACEGKPYDSLPKFQRAVCLDERLLDAVVNVYVRKVNMPDLAVEIAQGSVWRLLRVAAMLDKDDERHHALAAQVREQATGLLRAQCQQPDAPGEVLAQFAGICSSQGDHASAGKYYRRALATDCSNVPWRLRLARALAETGRTAEAIDQAHICLKLMPQMPAAKELISELNVRRVAVGQEEVRSLTCTE